MIIGRTIVQGPPGAETGHRDIDQSRVKFAQGVAAQAELVHNPGAIVVEQHIGPGRQATYRLDTRLVLEVNRQGALAPVAIVKQRRGPGLLTAQHAHGVTDPDRLHLDDPGALGAERHRRQ